MAVLGAMTVLVVGSPSWGSPGDTSDAQVGRRAHSGSGEFEHTGQDQAPPGDTGSSPDGEGGTEPPEPILDDESLCPGDVTGDYLVDVDDLIEVVLNWGSCGPSNICAADINDDGTVDVADLVEVIVGWGTCP